MCADGSEARIEEAVGQCELCGARIDAYGDSVEECCNYAQEVDDAVDKAMEVSQ